MISSTRARAAAAVAAFAIGLAVALALLLTHHRGRFSERFVNPRVSPKLHRDSNPGSREIPDYWREIERDHTLHGVSLDFLPGRRPSTATDKRVRVRRTDAKGRTRADLVTTHGHLEVLGADDATVQHRFEPNAATHGGTVRVGTALRLGQVELKDRAGQHVWDADGVVVRSSARRSGGKTKPKDVSLRVHDRVPALCIGKTCLAAHELRKLNHLLEGKEYSWPSFNADTLHVTRGTATRTEAQCAANTDALRVGSHPRFSIAAGAIDAAGKVALADDGSLRLSPGPGAGCTTGGVTIDKNLKAKVRFRNGGMCHGPACMRSAMPTKMKNLYANPNARFPYRHSYSCKWGFATCTKTKYVSAPSHLASRYRDKFNNYTHVSLT